MPLVLREWVFWGSSDVGVVLPGTAAVAAFAFARKGFLEVGLDELGDVGGLALPASESGRKWVPGPVSCDGSGSISGSMRYCCACDCSC